MALDELCKQMRSQPSYSHWEALRDELRQYGFREKSYFFKREQALVIDYLFLKRLGDDKEKGTWGITLNKAKEKEFEKLSSSYLIGRSNRGGFVGATTGMFAGGLFGMATAAIQSSHDIETFLTYVALGTGVLGVTGGITGHVLNRRRTKGLAKVLEASYGDDLLYSPLEFDEELIKKMI